MFTVQAEVVVARAPEDVFAFVADQTNAPRWQPGLIEVRRLTTGPIGVGTEHTFVRRVAGRRIEARNRYTKYEPSRLIAFEIADGGITGHVEYRLEPHAGGTLVTCVMEFTTRGLNRIAEPLMRRAIEREVRDGDRRLAELLESKAERQRDLPVE
ncbi:SRPBCC family protein [Agromyces sp. SYSU K20354]|uniref:SRPBCC family protein n=1 Tax=Agromyces cavernae TaxID=2898659 RepID=UPI001E488DB1|nr:SRPBCC family protein [Agromyces cavernae]MCD2441827.1 SRPBCC family protein [Agromyces cavernae]